MQYRKGDVVSMRGTVKHNFDDADDSDERMFIDVIGAHETLWLRPNDCTLVQYSFKVGDSARWLVSGEENSLQYGTILAINDGHAWIDLGGGDYCTRMLTMIERVEVSDDIA